MLQKEYKSFRTGRQLADCAVLIEQSWCVLCTTWKLRLPEFPVALPVPATERLTCVVGCDYYCSWKLLDFALDT
jgi:hypothetical protein